MAKFDVDMGGFDDLLENLDLLDRGEVEEKMLKAGEPILERSVKSHAAAHVKTGSMAASIKSTGVKQQGDGKYLVVRPTGKDKKGVRNMEKMAYLEFGTYKQAATPTLTPAVKESENAVLEAMQKAFDEATEGMKL